MMFTTERLLTLEAPTPAIKPNQVWQEFDKFEARARQGFTTEEEKMIAYASFVGTVSTFFNNPEVRKSQTPEVTELVNALFYHHETHAGLPIDFFIEAAKKIKHQVLDDGLVQPLDLRFKDEIGFIGKLTQQEFLNASMAAKGESDDRKTLESLAARASASSEPIAAIETQLTDTQSRQTRIKQVAIDQLAKDHELRRDIDRRDTFIAAIKRLQGITLTQEIINQQLTPFADFLKGGDVSVLDDLSLHLAAGYNPYVTGRLNELLQAAQDPDFIWQQWTERGVVPALLYSSFEQVSTLAELAEVSNLLSGLPKEVKAGYLLPYLEKGIDASLLREMAEGRFDLPDDLITQQVATFLDFCHTYAKEGTKKDKGWSTNKKVAVALIVAAVIAMPFIFKSDLFLEATQPNTIAEILNSLPPSELAFLEALGGEENPGALVIEGGAGQSGEADTSTGTSSIPNSSESNYMGNSNIEKPINDSPEGIIEAQKTVLWNLEGNDLWGFYRTASASRFVFGYYGQGWELNNKYALLHDKSIFSDQEDIKLSRSVKLRDQVFELPARANYVPSSEVEVKIGDLRGQVTTYQSTDGSYFLYFGSRDIGKTLIISYTLGKTDQSITPRPTSTELEEMKEKFITVGQLPEGELKTIMQQLKDDRTYSLAVKAKIIEKFLQNNFIYSLDSKWSDYYYSQSNAAEFFRRIAEYKKTDCDVANTMLIMLLRSINIPARIVYGEAHTGVLNPDKNTLTGAEGHGWAEVYIGGKWISLDATPGNMDEYTQKALEGKLSPSQLAQLSQQDDFIRRIASMQDQLNQFNNDPFLSGLLQITGLNLAALSVSLLLRRRNNRAVSRLEKEVGDRTRAYLGSSYPRTEGTFLGRESIRIGQEKVNNANPIPLIPPFGIIRLLDDLRSAFPLSRLPYRSETPLITQTEKPDVVEYLTKVLGYDERDARRRLYEETAGVAGIHITRQEHTIIATRLTRNVSYDLTGHFKKSLEDMTEPQDAQAWENEKRVLTEKLYRDYLSAIARRENKLIKEAARQHKNPKRPPRINREDFEKWMSELYRLRLVKWTIDKERVKALQSLERKGSGE